MSDLAGTRVLVTGAGKGIGRAIADELHGRGATVAALDLSPPDGPFALSPSADVSDEAAITAAFREAADALGGLDAVVANAGIVLERPLLETRAADFDRVIAVNLRGAFLTAREAARAFLDRPAHAPPARIVMIASELAHLGRAEYTAYCASKGGVVSLTRSLARELAPHVLVNGLAPGPIDTDMLKAERQYAGLAATAEGVPLGRLGRPEDIAGVVAFLLTPAAAFMTGSILDANGGVAMY